MIDVDHFKAVNDSLGYLAGDALLVKIAQTLRSSLRTEDVIGRWGGEEFIAVLPGADAGAALDVAERIRARVETHEPDAPASATVTIGVAVWTSGGMDELITRADDALYAGKSAGRNNVHIATVEAALAAP
jgi:diguanylate cyclase (GGDEF)-like protein